MSETMQTAQEILGQKNVPLFGGFHARITGYEYNDAFYHDSQRFDHSRVQGWNIADDMIRKGKIFYKHNFHKSHSDCNKGYAFLYGGFWVCNTCRNQDVDEPWWNIKVYADGNAFCCIGEGFEDLQASDNFAFGDTFDEAIKNYGELMQNRSSH